MSTDLSNTNTDRVAARKANLDAILARQLVTIFVRETPVYDADLEAVTSRLTWHRESDGSEDETSYVMRRLSIQRLTPELRAAFQAVSPEHHESILVMAAAENQQAREQLDVWRAQKGLDPRPDDDLMPTMLKLPLFVQTELLRLSMVEPTLEEVGGVAGIPDLEPVLVGAINANFSKLEVKEKVKGASDDVAVTLFRQDEVAAVPRAGEGVLETTALLGSAEGTESEGVQPEPGGAAQIAS